MNYQDHQNDDQTGFNQNDVHVDEQLELIHNSNQENVSDKSQENITNQIQQNVRSLSRNNQYSKQNENILINDSDIHLQIDKDQLKSLNHNHKSSSTNTQQLKNKKQSLPSLETKKIEKDEVNHMDIYDNVNRVFEYDQSELDFTLMDLFSDSVMFKPMIGLLEKIGLLKNYKNY